MDVRSGKVGSCPASRASHKVDTTGENSAACRNAMRCRIFVVGKIAFTNGGGLACGVGLGMKQGML